MLRKEASIDWSFIMLQGLCPQNLLYFSLQHDEVGAIIIPGLKMKKLRLRVSVTRKGHSLVTGSTKISVKFLGAVHQPLRDRDHAGSSRTSQGPKLGPFRFCQAFVFYCYHLSLSAAFAILWSKISSYVWFCPTSTLQTDTAQAWDAKTIEP